MKWLIYGASKEEGSGIGHSVAVSLSIKKHNVFGLSRKKEKTQDEQKFPSEAVDIGNEGGQGRVKEIIREFDPDVIWSASGMGFNDPLWALSNDKVEETIDTNIRKAVLFSRTCSPSCVDGGPHLIFTGSVVGVLGGYGASLYAGTKGFLIPFLRAQRNEYRRQGHNPKISLLVLPSIRPEDIDMVVDAVEYIGRQKRSIEVILT